MSGRKSTEVNGLLARGKDARDAGNTSYSHVFHMAEKILRKNESKITEISSRLSDEIFQIDKRCRTEFPKETKQLESSLQGIVEANRGISYHQILQGFQILAKQFEDELKLADKQGDKIRKKIKDKEWYCDDEYEEADRLLSKYQRIAQEKNRLVSKIHNTVQGSSQDLIRYENLEVQFLKIREAYERLWKRTTEIQELRSKAEQAKKYIEKIFLDVNPDLAKKFMSDEYSKLSDEVQQFCSLDDCQAVQNITAISERISVFSNHLQQCHIRFLEQKKRAETALDDNRKLLSTDKYFYHDPIEYFKKKENAMKIPLLDYLSAYSDQSEIIHSVEEGISLAEELVRNEEYDAAYEQADKNMELIEKAAAYAQIKQEHLMENFYAARDIKKVMINMGFETGAMKIGGNIKNGWRITAKSPGGESIDFSQVLIKDDGEVKIDIDHKTVGSCSSQWGDICGALDDVGIHIERIDMENGSNVINKRSGKNVSQRIPDFSRADTLSNGRKENNVSVGGYV